MVDGIVLMVEDNPKILDINRQMLAKMGLVVLTAKTIAETRERLAIAAPDVVVLDIMLPDGSGIEFLSELREVCDAPVLFLTAKTEQADIIAGLTAGGNDYITKPYDIDEFRARVMGFLQLVNSMKTKQVKTAPAPMASLLTTKELAIAVMAAEGTSSKNIAEQCCISDIRVRMCLTGIYKKLGLTDKKNKRAALAKILLPR